METETTEERCAEEKIADVDHEAIRDVISTAKNDGRKVLLEEESREIMDIADVPVAEGRVTYSLEECVEAAEEIGYPVALKVVSKDIVHKMDVGGLVLDLQDEDEVVDAYQSIMAHVKDREPNADIQGISVSEMIESGEEVVIGGMRDDSFGPVVMFGLGGIYVELLEDVVFRIAPLSKEEACEMIGDIETFPILVGARGKEKKDIDALARMITQIGDLMYNIDEISDIDLNPVAALSDGAKALDMAISLK